MKDTQPVRVRFAVFELDLKSGELLKGDERTLLQEQPLQVLRMLVEREGGLVTREDIKRKLWPNDTIVEFDHGINTVIRNLRRALGDSAEEPEYIETLARRGYRLMVTVEWTEQLSVASSQLSESTPASAVGTPVEAANLMGRTVSHYRVLDIIGGGGMGVVYRAEDLKLGRQVALKFLPEEVATDALTLQRFEREAQTASSLNHPHICTIYEFGEHGGQPFLVMESLQGETLRDRLAADESPQALPLNELLDIGIQVSDGLQAAHERGIIHRDIKPANIFLTDKGVCKILDFGIAKLLEGEKAAETPLELSSRAEVAAATGHSAQDDRARIAAATLTRAGLAMGTAGYMSPEQVRGEKLDARTDIFSFGLVLYEMATGRRAFSGETAGIVHDAIVNKTPIPLHDLNSKLPPELETIINKALEKDRERRYQSAAQMRADLEPVEHKTQSVFSGPRLRRGKLLATAAVVLVTLIVTGYSWRRWRTPESQSLNRESMEIRKLADTSNVDQIAISPDGRYVVYARRIGEKVSLRMRQVESGGDVEVLPAAEVDFVGLTFSPDGNYLYFVRSDKDDPGYKYLYVMPALGGPSRKLIADIDAPVSFSPDGRQFVFTRGFPMKNQVEVRIANPDGTGDHLLTTMQESNAGYQPGATWSPDGRTIAVPVFHRGKSVRSALYAVSVAEGGQRELYSTDGYVGRPQWYPDGSAILVTLYERNIGRGQLWTISFPSGKRERFTNDLSDYDLTLDMTPDGKNAVTVDSTQVSNIWASSAADISRLEQITFGESRMREAIETNDGKLLVLGLSELWIMDANRTARASFAKLDASQICRAGTFVVAGVRQEGLQHIVRLDADGTHATSLAMGNLVSPTCSPEGKFVFYADANPPQRILRVSIEGGTPVEIAKIPGDGLVGPVDVSNDGKSLAFPWEQFTPAPGVHLSVISSGDGSLVTSFAAPPGVYELHCLRWSPEDTALQYVLTRDGVANIWQQRLAGGPPQQITKFTSGLIFHFNRAKSDKRLLLARGSVTTDGVLLSHLR